MKKVIIIAAMMTVLALVLIMAGCEKETTLESTEYIREVEYVELPADTVYLTDTVFSSDSVTVPDTVIVSDTVVQTDYVYDTVIVHDTVVTVENHYDTVVTLQCDPNEHFAAAALEYYCDPLVIQFIYQQFGLNDGWVFYLSSFQVNLAQQSPGVYDIYGFIDYWTPDWSAFYPLEYYWRVTFNGGDPADMDNWQLSEPPALAAGYQPGIKLSTTDAAARRTLR